MAIYESKAILSQGIKMMSDDRFLVGGGPAKTWGEGEVICYHGNSFWKITS